MRDTNSLASQMVSVIPTVEEAAEITATLEEILDGKYKTKTNPFEALEELLPYSVKAKILEVYQAKKGSMNDSTQLYAFLEEVKKTLQDLPTLSLRLAATPSARILESIVGWVEENVGEPHLLEITVEEDLLGGAAIGYEGKMKDFSLRKKMPDLMQDS